MKAINYQLAAIGILAVTGVGAQESSPAKPSYVALIGGDVETVTDGLRRGATVLIKDDKILEIGRDVDLPEGTVRYDVTGKIVAPGFVAAETRGLGLGRARSQKIADALDPYQDTIQLALASGITSAYVESGSGGTFEDRTEGVSATSAVIKMSYGNLDGMLVREPAAVNLSSWISGTAAQRYQIRESFRKAQEFIEKLKDHESRKAAGKARPNEQPPKADALELYVQLLRGEIAARMRAPTADATFAALALINEFRFKAVLLDVCEAWTMPEEISRADCLCVMTPRRKWPQDKASNRPSGSSIEQAAILRRAGVRFAVVPLAAWIDTGGIAGRDLQTLPIEAAFAVRGGLDERTALASITITAAEVLGVSHRVGSLEAGKDADIVVLNGDPLDYRTLVDLTFVNGRLLYDRSKSPFYDHLK
ncbi:MAG: amidohydrolase family protein [Planctomycetes bacterium]|nr:amidohydrolase family protein [Planctomycetota bacterium]